MTRYGNSGCFGSGYDPEEGIDNIKEAAGAIDEIAGDAGEGTEIEDTTAIESYQASMIVLGEYLKRIRILTWAVIALAVVVIMREVKE